MTVTSNLDRSVAIAQFMLKVCHVDVNNALVRTSITCTCHTINKQIKKYLNVYSLGCLFCTFFSNLHGFKQKKIKIASSKSARVYVCLYVRLQLCVCVCAFECVLMQVCA